MDALDFGLLFIAILTHPLRSSQADLEHALEHYAATMRDPFEDLENMFESCRAHAEAEKKLGHVRDLLRDLQVVAGDLRAARTGSYMALVLADDFIDRLERVGVPSSIRERMCRILTDDHFVSELVVCDQQRGTLGEQ